MLCYVSMSFGADQLNGYQLCILTIIIQARQGRLPSAYRLVIIQVFIAMISNIFCPSIYSPKGHDTTASAISWCLYNLALHPDIQQRAYEEVDSVVGARDSPLISW